MTLIFKGMKKELLIFFILTILLSLAMVSEAYWLQLLIDTIRTSQLTYILMATLVIVFILLQTLIYYFQQLLTAVLSKQSAFYYRQEVFKKIQKSPLSLLTGDKNDKLLSSLTSQIDQIEQYYFYSIYWGFYLICQLLMAVIISLYLNPFLAVLTLILSLPNLLLGFIFKKYLEKSQEDLMVATNSSISKIQDIVVGLVDWKTAQAECGVLQRFGRVTAELLDRQVRLEKSQYLVISLNQLFSNILYFGSWIIGGLLIMNHQLTLGGLIAFSQLLARISYPVYASSDLLAKYISGKKAMVNLNEEFLLGDSGLEITEPIELISCQHLLLPRSSHRPFEASFWQGKKYLLQGKSGSGKTTLLKSLLGEYTAYQGTIMINGCDIKGICETSLFAKMAYVPQQPHLFEASLRDNLTLFSEIYSDQEIFDVLHFVELSQWANSHALSTLCSSDKVKLSGGEIKRVALARALLMNKEVLLLDEFSSGIDSETLLKIEARLLDLEQMVIYITHVKSQFHQRCDQVFDLD